MRITENSYRYVNLFNLVLKINFVYAVLGAGAEFASGYTVEDTETGTVQKCHGSAFLWN